MSWTLPTNEDGLVPCHSSPKHSYPQPLLPGHNQPATIYKRDFLFIWRRLGNVSLCLVRSRIKRQIFWESLYSEIPKNRQIMSAYSQTCELFFGLFVFFTPHQNNNNEDSHIRNQVPVIIFTFKNSFGSNINIIHPFSISIITITEISEV